MSDDGTTTGGGSCNDRMQTDGSRSTADSMKHNLFGMSDDGVSTDRGTGNTANVHNAAGNSSGNSSEQLSMAEGSGEAVAETPVTTKRRRGPRESRQSRKAAKRMEKRTETGETDT